MESTVLKGGQKPNVTDTPGLFDPSDGIDFIGKEIVRCIDLARDGIHAILIGCSIRNRFSREEQDTIQALQDLFGDKIANYIILIFTGGDDFPDKDDPLANYLGPNCPKAFQNVLQLCRGRVVLFDNKTKDETKRAKQVEQSLLHVNTLGKENCGQPYFNEYFIQLKEVKSLKGSSEKEA